MLVGSNPFNLAAMIGLTGLLSGSVRLSRDTLLLEGSAGACVMPLGVAVLLGWLAPVLAVALTACVPIPYVLAISGANRFLGRLAGTLDPKPPKPRPHNPTSHDPTYHLLGLIATIRRLARGLGVPSRALVEEDGQSAPLDRLTGLRSIPCPGRGLPI